MPNTDYSKPDPELIERVCSASDDELSRYLENAKRKLPDTRWLVDAIAQEQIKRGGLQNLTAESVRQIILEHARGGTNLHLQDDCGGIGRFLGAGALAAAEHFGPGFRDGGRRWASAADSDRHLAERHLW